MYHIVPHINTHHNIVIWYQMCYIFIHYFIGYKLPNPTPQAWWDPMDPTKPKALGPGAELDDTLSVSWRGWMSMPSMSLSSQVLKSKKSQWWCSGMFGLSLLKFTEMQEHQDFTTSYYHILYYLIFSSFLVRSHHRASRNQGWFHHWRLAVAKDQTRRHLLPPSQGALQADVSDVSSSIADPKKRYTKMPKSWKPEKIWKNGKIEWNYHSIPCIWNVVSTFNHHLLLIYSYVDIPIIPSF